MSAVGSANMVPHLCLVSLGLLNLQNQGPLFWTCLQAVSGCLLKVLVAVTVSDSVCLLTGVSFQACGRLSSSEGELFILFLLISPALMPQNKDIVLGLPWGPVVKNPSYNARDMGLIPGRGTNISHTAEQLSP